MTDAFSLKCFVNKRDLRANDKTAIDSAGLEWGMNFVKLLQNLLAPFINRHRYRRLIEFDGSRLIQIYGNRAVARALEFDAQGSTLDGRRKGHWRRVARCIAGRPLPIRSNPIFG